MTQFKDKSGRSASSSRPGCFNYPVLMAADVLALPRRRGAGRRRPAPARRADARRRRSASTRASARRSSSPSVVIPEVGARIMDLQTPRRRCRRPAARRRARCYVTDEPDAIVKKFESAVTDSGSRDPPRARQGRDQQPARDPRRGPRGQLDRAARARVRRRRLRRLQARRRRGGGRLSGARARALQRRCAPTSRGSSGCWRSAPTRPRAIAPETMRDVRTAMGVGPVRQPG